MENNSLEKNNIISTANTSTSTQNDIELISIDVDDDNDPLLGEPVPKTAKDLFSDFKASDESDFELNDNEISDSDSDLPLLKRTKLSKKKTLKKTPTNEDGTVKKKVCNCVNGFGVVTGNFVFVEKLCAEI